MLYNKGDRLKVKGRPGVHVVHWPVTAHVPTIKNGQFLLIERTHYKFWTGKEWFYAWEDECTKEEKKK